MTSFNIKIEIKNKYLIENNTKTKKHKIKINSKSLIFIFIFFLFENNLDGITNLF